MLNQKNKILIFNLGGIEFLNKIIKDERKRFVILDEQSKKNNIIHLINPVILLSSIRYLLTGIFPVTFNWKKKIFGAFLCALVKKTKANTVISYKGAFSIFFGVLANNFPNKIFIGIAWAQVHQRILNRTTLSHNIKYFVFGDYDVDAYMSIGHKKENLLPVGGLIGGYYKTEISKNDISNKYGFCIVSQVVDMWFEDGIDKMPGRENGKRLFNTLMDYFVLYLKENKDKNYKIAVALRPQDKSLTKGEYEENYFREYLQGFDYDIIQNKPLEFSTYQAMDESEVIINHYSTSCFEALSWDKKILFCQFYDYPKFPIPEDLFWKVTEPNYEIFKEQLDTLIHIKQKDYSNSILSIKKKYCNMGINNPPHKIIKDYI